MPGLTKIHTEIHHYTAPKDISAVRINQALYITESSLPKTKMQ